MSNIRLCRADQLPDAEWAAWSRIQHDRPDLDSPFFSPEFTRLVSDVRDDVEVAVITNDTLPVAFFPFQRGPRGAAQAVCGRLSEFHGLIAETAAQIHPGELLQACGLTSWHFDHLPVSQTQLQSCFWGESDSPCINLSGGFEGYRQHMRMAGSSVSQAERKGRKLAREVGPLRFDFHTADAAAFDALLQWKTEQHRRTNVLQVLRIDWVRRLLERVRSCEADGFRGVFSALYAGDRLAAVHLGLQSPTALHIWFPAYNVELEQYSPGLILLLELAKVAADRGVQRIDFGRGGERYKRDFASASIRIAEGAIDRRWLAGPAHRRWFETKAWIRRSPWRNHLERPLIASRRLRQWIAFR